MKFSYKSAFLIILTAAFSLRCKTPEPGPNLVRNWVAQEVKEGGTLVYRRGSADNIYPGYAQFRIGFTPSAVTFTELSGEQFTGTWELTAGNDTLTFRELMPVPFGTEGTIVFALVSWDQNNLVLRRETPNPKTGGTVNEYALVPE